MPPPLEAGDKELEIWLYCGTMGGWANKNQDLMDSLPLCVLRCICQHHKQQRHAPTLSLDDILLSQAKDGTG